MEKDYNSFVKYFGAELAVLEDECAQFAMQHPQIASNLGLNSEGSSDPHVRQIIESVAFIAARLKRHMDGITSELVSSLARALAPHQYFAVPSMAIARLSPLSNKLPATGLTPPVSLQFKAEHNGTDCIFSAITEDIKIWPFSVKATDAKPDQSSSRNTESTHY